MVALKNYRLNSVLALEISLKLDFKPNQPQRHFIFRINFGLKPKFSLKLKFKT